MDLTRRMMSAFSAGAITFYISVTRIAGVPAILEFTAEEDMTGMDFISSNFNDGRFSIYEIPNIKTTVQFKTETGYGVVVGAKGSVNIFDKILDDYTYSIT